tara:strand:+ start:84 stop:527 length:444 start_codon:yes stop_codon:yes gene_type:complete
MKLTKQQLKQIIKEELEKVLSERGFGEGEPAKDEFSKKREVYLEEDADDYSTEKLSNGLIRIRKKDSGLVGLYNQDGSYKSGDLRLSKDKVNKLVGIKEKKLTKPEKKEKEKIVTGMKKNKGDFEERYPGRGEEVMYATATKMAKKK